MSKKKSSVPDKKLKDKTWISFYIPNEEHEKWRAYSNSLNMRLAKLIKEVMRREINGVKKEQNNRVLSNLERSIADLEFQLKSQDEKYNKILDILLSQKDQSRNSNNTDKKRIKSILTSFGNLSTNKLREITGIENNELRIMLREMEVNREIIYYSEERVWGVG